MVEFTTTVLSFNGLSNDQMIDMNTNSNICPNEIPTHTIIGIKVKEKGVD